MRGIIVGLGLAQGSEEGGTPPVPYSNTKSCTVDGIDEYFDCGSPAAFGGVNQPFSASVWFRSETNTACDLFGKWGGLGPRDWVIYMSAGRVYAYMQTSVGLSNAVTAQTYNDGAWHLATITWDSSNITVDVDGGADRVSTAAATRLSTAGSRTYLGARDNGSGGYVSSTMVAGNLEEASFWSKGLSAAECIEIYNSGVPMDLASHSAAADLVSWYRMGDASGDSAESSDPSARIKDVKSGNDATPKNTDIADIVTEIPPTFNRLSLLTDGVDEYAELAAASVTGCEFDFNQPWSVSAWVKSSFGGASAGYVASKIRGAPHYMGWAVGFYNGNPFCFFSHSVLHGAYAQSYVDQYMCTGAWKHVVWTYDGSGTLAGGMKMYVNGTDTYPQGQVTTSYIDTIGGNSTLGGATAPLRLGAASYGEYFDGSFDEVSIWSKELSAVEVDTMYNSGKPTDLTGSADLDAYYRCGEAAGDSATGTIHDLSGNANNLAANNMEAADMQSVTPRPYWNLLSIGFDGVDERLYSSPASNAPLYDTGDPFSVSCWFKTSTGTYGALVAKESSHPTYVGWCLFMHPGGIMRVELSAGAGTYVDVWTTASGWNDGNWHHVLMTYSGGGVAASVTVYVDGAIEATATLSDTLGGGSILTSDPLTIGCRGDTALGAWLPYNGRVDEVSLYNTTLTAANAVELYNNGKPRDAQTLTTESYIDAYYRCGDDTFDAKAGGQATVFDKTVNDYDLWQANMEQADFDLDVP